MNGRGALAIGAAVLGAACAADPGDPLKTAASATGSEVFDDAGETSPSNDDDAGASEAAAPPPSTVQDASPGGSEADTSPAIPAGDSGDAAPPPPPADGGCDLTSIPASCPDCMTQNASDQPICQKYLACFAMNACDPNTSCGSNTGVCGVNTIGGGEAPYTAAVATYACACP
jgi:hypothetical protein